MSFILFPLSRVDFDHFKFPVLVIPVEDALHARPPTPLHAPPARSRASHADLCHPRDINVCPIDPRVPPPRAPRFLRFDTTTGRTTHMCDTFCEPASPPPPLLLLLPDPLSLPSRLTRPSISSPWSPSVGRSSSRLPSLRLDDDDGFDRLRVCACRGGVESSSEGGRHARETEDRVHLRVHRHGLAVPARAHFGAIVVRSVVVVAT